MKKTVFLMVVIVIVFGFGNVVGPENIKKTGTEKRRVVPLQTFVNAVAGRTDTDIEARFGRPSCKGHAMFLGMIYENFVKDERTGEILSVQVLFKIGIPAGMVKMRGGREVISSSDFRFVASSIRCPQYTFEVEDANDPVVQKYSIYIRPWRATSLFPMNTQPIPSCEELNRENDRINQKIERDKKTEREVKKEREERKKKKETFLKSAVERLIGGQMRQSLSFGGRYPPDIPNWEKNMSVTASKKLREYVFLPVRNNKNPPNVLEGYVIEDRHKDGVDYVIFKSLIHCDQKKVSVTFFIIKTGEGSSEDSYNKSTGFAGAEHYKAYEVYADNSPIDLIASNLCGRSANPNEIDNSKETKAEIIAGTQQPDPMMKEIGQMPPHVQETSRSSIQNKTIVTVTWTSAIIRSGADNTYPSVANVKQGDKLIVIGQDREWFNVRLENGKQGWISNRVVK